jgi:hypothetical protein
MSFSMTSHTLSAVSPNQLGMTWHLMAEQCPSSDHLEDVLAEYTGLRFALDPETRGMRDNATRVLNIVCAHLSRSPWLCKKTDRPHSPLEFRGQVQSGALYIRPEHPRDDQRMDHNQGERDKCAHTMLSTRVALSRIPWHNNVARARTAVGAIGGVCPA